MDQHAVTWWDGEWTLVCAGRLGEQVVGRESCDERAEMTCTWCGEDVRVAFTVELK